MFKLLTITLAVISLNEAAISHLQLVASEDPYSILNSGKVSTSSSRGSSSISLSNAISEEDISSSADIEESEEASAAPPSASASSPVGTPSPATSSAPVAGAAAISRLRPGSTISAISSSGLSRGSILISSSASSSAQASASSASSPSASARSSTTIQHRILPAEAIPLPITISQRPGLRTVIAPETITIQQPTIAKVGEVVQQIPTAVSHQRQTVVHKHARVVTPIVAPAVRTVTSQIVRAYHTPLVYAPHLINN